MMPKLYLTIILIIVSFLFGLDREGYTSHNLEFIEQDSQVLKLIEELCISSNILPPEINAFYTYGDLKDDLAFWKESFISMDSRQRKIIEVLDAIVANIYKPINESTFASTVDASVGLDYIYHPTIESDLDDSLYFGSFRDRDFITKYDQRGNNLDFKMRASYMKSLYFSLQYGFRENWIGLNMNDHHFKMHPHDINNDFNQEGYIAIKKGPFFINVGRSRFSLGIGNHGKLFIGKELPPLDAIRFSIKIGDKTKFYSYLTSINNTTLEHLLEERFPKYLFAHRISFDITPRIRIGFNEMLVMNSYLKWEFMNPLLIYHNLTNLNYLNSVSGFDIDITPLKNIRMYFSFALDEADISIEIPDETRGSRLALGVQGGIEFIDLLGLKQSQLVFEYLKTDRWLYGYKIPDDLKDLSLVYNEETYFPNDYNFYRYIGHYLGPNTNAFFTDMKYKNISLHLIYLSRGNSYVLNGGQTWDEDLPNIIEQQFTVHLDWVAKAISQKMSLRARLGYSWSQNYHHVEGMSKEWPELWLNMNYKLFSFI